jgi:O-antigen/teichoic acid export membrane protein
MFDALWLWLAWFAATAGMGWLALSLDNHWQQVTGTRQAHDNVRNSCLRLFGALGLILSLGLCLAVDHASMAALVWVMLLAAAAVCTAITLTWRPHWLKLLLFNFPKPSLRESYFTKNNNSEKF